MPLKLILRLDLQHGHVLFHPDAHVLQNLCAHFQSEMNSDLSLLFIQITHSIIFLFFNKLLKIKKNNFIQIYILF